MRSIAIFASLLLLLGLAFMAAALPASAQAVFQPPELPCPTGGICPARRSCNEGFCRQRCEITPDCRDRTTKCDGGFCKPIDNPCRTDSDCGPRAICDVWQNNSCRQVQCTQHSQCPQPGACSRNNCTSLQCLADNHCRPDQRCDRDYECQNLCPSGEIYVRSTTVPVCTACVPARTQAVSSATQCALDRVYASPVVRRTAVFRGSGFCIPKCTRGGQLLKPGRLMLREPGILLAPGAKPGVVPPSPQPDPSPTQGVKPRL